MNQDYISEISDYGPTESGVVRKNIAGMFDAVITAGLFIGITSYLPQSITMLSKTPFRPECYIFLLLALYRLLCLFLIGGTVGMKLVKIKLLNGYNEPLTKKEKAFAAFFILPNGVAYYRDEEQNA